MDLNDLFVSFKQVNPVQYQKPHIELPKPIYLNLDRAQKVANDTESDNTQSNVGDMTDWRVKGISELEDDEDSGNDQNWRTGSIQTKPTQPKPVQSKPEQPKPSQTKSEKEEKIINNQVKSYQNQRDLWIADMTNSYKKLGLNDNAIKNLIAQTALESNYGQSVLSGYNNFGGITTGAYWTGKRIKSGDKDKDGNRITQDFRVYDDMDHFTRDHLEFLTKLYDFDQNDDLNTFLNKLLGNNKGKRKYAQAKDYSKAVTNRYNQIFA